MCAWNYSQDNPIISHNVISKNNEIIDKEKDKFLQFTKTNSKNITNLKKKYNI